MKVATYSYVNQHLFRLDGDISHGKGAEPDKEKVALILGFGVKSILSGEPVYPYLQQEYPLAEIVFCSTSGEIFGNTVADGTLIVTAIEFEKTKVRAASVNIDDFGGDSYAAGLDLVSHFELVDQLCYIMIISDGRKVNGSELVKGINERIRNKVPVTGGMAGDGYDFRSTLTGLNEIPRSGKIIAIAFYGEHLVVAYGSDGGWETFGPERTVTKSAGNQLFEINYEYALDVYEKYLGPYAADLPGSALLFPLSVRLTEDSEPVVRTILSIDAQSRSMVFAGDVPEGSSIRFMKGNFDKLIDAANQAARQTFHDGAGQGPALALLISSVGRKIILGERVEEEVEAVREVLGKRALLTGFYSHGEISPFADNVKCELHNQTMTITTFDEK
jgi:hypothetical protein